MWSLLRLASNVTDHSTSIGGTCCMYREPFCVSNVYSIFKMNSFSLNSAFHGLKEDEKISTTALAMTKPLCYSVKLMIGSVLIQIV